MRWLIDEGLPKALVGWLVGRGDDVLDVAATPLRGSSDIELWAVAAQQARAVMTRDLGFVPPRSGVLPPAVVFLRAPHTYGAMALLRLAQEGLAEVAAESLCGNLTVIQPGHVRQRKLAGLTTRVASMRDETPDSDGG
ncbi:DUF5615 family PIN-like protein [bacterium]|nr:DUF5615 family PIN-like protein [bacterium]